MTETEIANLAISQLGVGTAIASLTEKSVEARACNRWYPQARNATLRRFEWPFATRFVALGLVATDPTDEWRYSYRYPSGCLKLRKLVTAVRNVTRQTDVPFRIASDTSGELIYTDEQSATAEYTALITDTEKFTDDFVIALSFKLAMFVAPQICGGDPVKSVTRMTQLYQMAIGEAMANAANEDRREEAPTSEFITTRG